jgi:hypothetical protein
MVRTTWPRQGFCKRGGGLVLHLKVFTKFNDQYFDMMCSGKYRQLTSTMNKTALLEVRLMLD